MSEQLADQSYDAYDDPYAGTPPVGLPTILLNWVGALVSIGLVGGLGVWGYNLTVRDVTEIPVVRALEGPLRIQPEDPGGQTAAHQGLAVNSVQAEGGVQAPAVQVLLAPRPVDLSDEDLAQAVTPVISGDVETNVIAINTTDVSAESESAAQLGEDVMAVLRDNDTATALARLPGVKRSPRPKARPGTQVVNRDSTGAAALLTQQGANVDANPSTIPTGSRLVQLGAFDDKQSAIKEWVHIMGRHSDLIGERKRLIQKAESGGRDFFRLRVVGFGDLNDSRRLCSALLARGTPCIPVTAR